MFDHSLGQNEIIWQNLVFWAQYHVEYGKQVCQFICYWQEIQNGSVESTCTMLQDLHNAIEEKSWNQDKTSKLIDLGLLEMIPFYTCLLYMCLLVRYM